MQLVHDAQKLRHGGAHKIVHGGGHALHRGDVRTDDGKLRGDLPQGPVRDLVRRARVPADGGQLPGDAREPGLIGVQRESGQGSQRLRLVVPDLHGLTVQGDAAHGGDRHHEQQHGDGNPHPRMAAARHRGGMAAHMSVHW